MNGSNKSAKEKIKNVGDSYEHSLYNSPRSIMLLSFRVEINKLITAIEIALDYTIFNI